MLLPQFQSLLTNQRFRIALLLGLVATTFAYFTPRYSVWVVGPQDVVYLFVTSEVDTPLMAYKLNTGDYPTTQQGLQALITQPVGVKGWQGPYFNKDWKGPHLNPIKTVPLDPWGHPYQYAYPSTHHQPAGKYDCWSLGPDGIDGTADDIGNWPDAPNK